MTLTAGGEARVRYISLCNVRHVSLWCISATELQPLKQVLGQWAPTKNAKRTRILPFDLGTIDHNIVARIASTVTRIVTKDGDADISRRR